MNQNEEAPKEQQSDGGSELEATGENARSARVVPPRRRRRWRWLLTTVMAVAVLAFAASFLTEYSPAAQLPLDIGGVLPGSSPKAAADDCIRCHNATVAGAALFLAVNGAVVDVNRPVQIAPGDSFELAMHFTGMLGDPKRFKAVGAQILAPDKPVWRVVPGTRNRPKEWVQTGQGVNFWSAAWENGGNGDGPQYMRWVSSPDAPSRYYLGLVGTPFPISEEAAHGAVLADRGKEDVADRDGMSNHSGTTAIFAVPFETSPGTYNITVAGIGHDVEGKKANVSRTFQVLVGTAAASKPSQSAGQSGGSVFVPATGQQQTPTGQQKPSAVPATAKPAPVVPTGTALYQANCSGCHGSTPNRDLLVKGVDEARRIIVEGTKKAGGSMPGKGTNAGGKLSDPEIALILEYLQNKQKYPTISGAPVIAHGLEGRDGKCDWCHGLGKVRPFSGGHESYGNEGCLGCHKLPPKMPHNMVGREVCDACHTVPAKR